MHITFVLFHFGILYHIVAGQVVTLSPCTPECTIPCFQACCPTYELGCICSAAGVINGCATSECSLQDQVTFDDLKLWINCCRTSIKVFANVSANYFANVSANYAPVSTAVCRIPYNNGTVVATSGTASATLGTAVTAPGTPTSDSNRIRERKVEFLLLLFPVWFLM